MTLWFFSDPHFGQASMLKYMKHDLRTCSAGEQQCDAACKATHPLLHVREFASVEEMDETIVDRWNSVVKPNDHAYLMGDVAMDKANLPIVKRLNGKRRLLLGNHDPFHKEYPKYFQKIFASRTFDSGLPSKKKILFTHFPIHPRSIESFAANVHGHTHTFSYGLPYINVSAEVINYTPVSLEELRWRLK